jgi:hypothetical protein
MQVIGDEDKNYDLSKLSFEDFERFFFDRPVLKPAKGRTFEGEFCPDVCSFESSSPDRTIASLERLFTEFKRLNSKYSLRQFNQGVWTLLGCGVQIQDHLWDQRVQLAHRERCIHSMVIPYRDVVSGDPAKVLENCFEMWWDLVAGAFWSRIDYGNLPISQDDRSVLEAMFSTLCETLALPDEFGGVSH